MALDLNAELARLFSLVKQKKKIPVGQANAILSQCKRENKVELAEKVIFVLATGSPQRYLSLERQTWTNWRDPFTQQ